MKERTWLAGILNSVATRTLVTIIIKRERSYREDENE